MNKIPVYIINYNLKTWPEKMCQDIEAKWGEQCHPVIVDNNSTLQHTLDWYKDCPYEVLKMDHNYGHTVVWAKGLQYTHPNDLYIVTDPDFELGPLPADTIDFLTRGLYQFNCKAGLSIPIDDMPDEFPQKAQIIAWETGFWKNPLIDGFYQSPVDTTFAIYSKSLLSSQHTIQGVRAAPPYAARHLPFYLTPDTIDQELADYILNVNPQVSTMGRLLRPLAEEYYAKQS